MLLSMAHLPNLKKETMAEVALTTKVGRHPFETSTCKPMVPSTQLLLVIIELFLLRFPQVTPFLRGGISWYATIKSMQFMALPLGSAECGTSRILYVLVLALNWTNLDSDHGKYLNLSDLVVPRCPSWTGRTLCGGCTASTGSTLTELFLRRDDIIQYHLSIGWRRSNQWDWNIQKTSSLVLGVWKAFSRFIMSSCI